MIIESTKENVVTPHRQLQPPLRNDFTHGCLLVKWRVVSSRLVYRFMFSDPTQHVLLASSAAMRFPIPRDTLST